MLQKSKNAMHAAINLRRFGFVIILQYLLNRFQIRPGYFAARIYRAILVDNAHHICYRQ